jgi:Domain of unknown function (DUF4394)
MRTRTPRLALLLSAALLALAAAAPARAATITTVAPGNQLLAFNSANPNAVISSTQITGLGMGEEILGIDLRPATGQLYALGNSNRLYTIDLTTGAATPVGSPGQFTLNGGDFGFDFDPVADRLRVVSDADQNLLLDPNTGMQVGPQPNLFFSMSQGAPNPNVVGSAYSNNFPGAMTSELFAIDSELDALLTQNPTGGQLMTRGPLFVNPGDLLGLDIAPEGTAYFIAGFPGGSFFHFLNLATGQATSVGGPMSQQNLDGLAVVPDPTSPGTGDGMGGTTGGGTGLAGDFDLDGIVDLADLATLLAAPLDEDGVTVRVRTPNGVVVGSRLTILTELLANYGRTSSAAQRRRARRTVVARRKVTLLAGQRKRVRVPLTKTGRRFYRQYKRKRLRATLRLKVTYRPPAGATVQRRTFRKALRLRVVQPKRRR